MSKERVDIETTVSDERGEVKKLKDNGASGIIPVLPLANLNHVRDSSDDDWDSDEETPDGSIYFPEEPILCLLCSHQDLSVKSLIKHHIETDHEITLTSILSGQEDYIQFVNYCRWMYKETDSYEDVLVIIKQDFGSSEYRPWRDTMFYKPLNPDDPVVMFDFQDYMQVEMENNITTNCSQCDQNDEATKIEFLMRTIEKLKVQNDHLREVVDTAIIREEGMRNTFANLIDESVPDIDSRSHDHPFRESPKYFESYGDVGIHLEMLQDKRRTLAYRDYITLNEEEFTGKTVLDLGCGTGILSLFAATAGAAKVYAVDRSEIIINAIANFHSNNVARRVQGIKGELEVLVGSEINEKVDIIISEWMGYFLLYEGMIFTLMHARDYLLKENGSLVPNKASMYMALISDKVGYERDIESWNDMYGYNMSSMKSKSLSEPTVLELTEDFLISDPCVLCHLDLETCSRSDLEISTQAILKAKKSSCITGLVGYFDVAFDKFEREVVLNTGPQFPRTHWNQTVFYLPRQVPVYEGEEVPLRFKCTPHPDNRRWLNIKINILGMELHYEFK